jgi:hypothetical protein
VQIISDEMSVNQWYPTFNIAMVRQSLLVGQNSFGGIGFTTIDDSNNSGQYDAARIAIINNNGADILTGTSMAFYTQVGSVLNTNPATEQMRIRSNGNVLIGTTTDAGFKLDVNGTGRFSGALGGTSATFSSSVTATAFIPSGATIPTNGMYLSAANTLNFATASTNRLTISSTGAATFLSNVTAGFETSSGYATLNLIDSGAGSARYASIRKNYDSPFDLRIRASNSTIAAPIVFDLSSAVEAMRITSGGNVGIGTTSPAAKLEVNVGLNSLKISGRDTYVDSTEDATNANIYVTQTGVGDFSQLAGSLVFQARTQGTVYRDIIFAGGLSNGDALMTIKGTGNLLVGTTTNSGFKLDVNGTGNFSGALTGTSATFSSSVTAGGDVLVPYDATDRFIGSRYSGTYYNGLVLNGTAHSTGIVSRSGDALDYIWFGTNAATERMRISNGGNLGVGTTTIGSKLQVNGNAAIGYSASTAAPTNGLAVLGNVSIGTSRLLLYPDTPAGANASTKMGYMFSTIGTTGSTPAGSFIEDVATGTILSYGVNVPQAGARDTAYVGGIFRLDTRASNQEFTVLGFPTGGSSEASRISINLQTGKTVLAPVAGNVLIGTSTDAGFKLDVNGSGRFSSSVTATSFNTATGNTGSIADNTFVTMFTLSTAGMYILRTRLLIGTGDANNYTAFATIMYDGSAARIVANNTSFLIIQLSGSNVQVKQTSGTTATTGVTWGYLLI